MAAAIVAVIQHYHPDWQPPKDNGRTWIPCCCPFHDDSRASAAISYEWQSYKCMACGAKGTWLTLIVQQEGTDYRAAKHLAETILAGRDTPVQPKSARKSGRSLLGNQRSGRSPDRAVLQPGVRRRGITWT